MFLAPIPIPKLRSPDKIQNSTIVKKFPVKFWKLINSCKSNAVCWGLGGNTVRILREKFEEEYLLGENRAFKTVSFSSFVRQLNLYGFRKVIRPVITNELGQKLNTSLIEYKHPMFLKGHPELLPHIKRNTKSFKTDGMDGTSGKLIINNVFLKRKLDDKENIGHCVQQAKVCRTDVGPILCNAAKLTQRPLSYSVMKPMVTLACQLQSSVQNADQQTMRMPLREAENLGLVKRVPFNQVNTTERQEESSATCVTMTETKPTQTEEDTFSQALHLSGKNESWLKAPGLQTVTAGSEGISERTEEAIKTLQIKNPNQDQGISVNKIPTARQQTLTLIRGTNNGQSVIYLKHPNQGKPVQISKQMPKVKPQPVVVYNIPKPAQQDIRVTSLPLSATCEQVASHPLLQPVRRDIDIKVENFSTGSKNIPFQKRQYYPSHSASCLPSIPENESQTNSAVPESVQSQKELADLMLFNLSSSLKDIEDPTSVPQERCIEVDVEVRTPEDNTTVKIGSMEEDTTPEVPQESCSTTDPPEDADAKIQGSDFFSGPRHELFKGKKSNRITIPLSGLPKEIFFPCSDLYKTDRQRAVVTIETSEDGKVTGHLIFPRNAKTEDS